MQDTKRDTEYQDKRQHYSQQRLRHGSKPFRKRYRKLQSNLEAPAAPRAVPHIHNSHQQAIATHNAYA